MSEHKITLTWKRGDTPFEYQKYPRDHTWKFDGGHEMQASAAPAYLGNPKLVDPEEAFVGIALELPHADFPRDRLQKEVRARRIYWTMRSATWRKMRKADLPLRA